MVEAVTIVEKIPMIVVRATSTPPAASILTSSLVGLLGCEHNR